MALFEVAVGAGIKAIADAVATVRANAQAAKVSVDQRNTGDALRIHFEKVAKWASKIAMGSLRREKQLNQAFVDLVLEVGFMRHAKPSTQTDTQDIGGLYGSHGHVAIVGRPGAGKTTTLQRVAQLALAERELPQGRPILLVSLRDLRAGESLVETLLSILGISVTGNSARVSETRLREWRSRTLHVFLENASPLLLVDGLDECEAEARLQVEHDIRDIALAPGAHRLFLTCRTAEYRLTVMGLQPYTILPLSPDQVTRFALQWLGPERAPAFLDAVSRTPYAGSEVVPLTLGHLCALYDRDGKLPPRPIDVYEEIVSLLVEDWDRERGVRRASQYADFRPRKKERFLQALAYSLALEGRRGAFSRDDLRRAYVKSSREFDLPMNEERAVLDEVESHTGLIQLSGPRQYEFVHLAIQEFLAAMHALRAPNGMSLLIPRLPHEAALATAYSSDPDDTMEYVLSVALRLGDRARSFCRVYIERLSTEHVSVSQVPRMGWVLLGLLDLVGDMLDGDALDEAVSDEGSKATAGAALLSFFQQNSTRGALRLALDRCSQFGEQRAVRLIPKQGVDMPPFLQDYLRGKPHGGFAIHRGFAEDELQRPR